MKRKAEQGALQELLGMLMPSMLGEIKKKDEDEKKKVEPTQAKSLLEEGPEENHIEEREEVRPKPSLSFTQIKMATEKKPKPSPPKKKRRPLGKDRG